MPAPFRLHGACHAAESGLRAAELLRSAGDLFGVAGVYGFTVIDLTQLGRLDEAKRVNEELEPLCKRVGHEPALLYPLVVEAIERTGSVCGSIYDGRLIQRAAGIAAMAGGRYEEADAHFRTALEQSEAIPHRPEQAHTERWYG